MSTEATEVVAGGGSVFLTPSSAGDEARFTCWEGIKSTDLDLDRQQGTALRDALSTWLNTAPAPAASSPVPQAATGTVAEPAAAPVARDQRYGQCDSTCTVDCGHCKGAGAPAAPVARGECFGCVHAQHVGWCPASGSCGCYAGGGAS